MSLNNLLNLAPDDRLTLQVEKPTWLKRSTEQAADIAKNENKRFVRPGEQYRISKVEEVVNHLQIELIDPLDNKTTWYAFADHVELLKNDSPLILTNPATADRPQSDRSDPPDIARLIPRGKGTAFQLPGRSGTFYTSDPILGKGGHFSWAEATHGGTRIPSNRQQVENIFALAERLEKVRTQLGNQPLKVTSWHRPEPHNARAGGARNSVHLNAGAVDLLRAGMNGRQMANILRDWPGGLGIYRHFPNLLHFDIRGYRARWGGA